ncbi:MAG: ABC transporter substrate-binding protein [Bacteroidetes bacterium]|nr:MAG: ABC transporter substrate-binding protein [Bacteroidota bacterium]
MEKGAVFRLNLDEGLSTLDPAFARSRAPVWMTAQLFNGLVRLDSTLKVQPELARHWDISPDGQTYTFHLRRDVYFHRDAAFGPDSTRRVVARDVVYSFQRICDPATASTGKWVFNGKIEGLTAFDAGEASDISGFQALDDSTVQIRLTGPFPPFLSLLAMPYGYVVPREAIEAYGEDFRRRPVGTGPFRFYRWVEGQQLILHRHPDYFKRDASGQALPYLDALSVRFIPSRLSAFIEFVQGRLDFIGDLDESYRDEILTRDGAIQPAYADKYQFLLAPQLNTEYLGFLVDDSLSQGHPLGDRRLRQALNYAIDRPRLVRFLLNGMGYPAESGFIPYGMPGFDAEAVPGYIYDPALAQALLREAGYPSGQGLPPLTLYSTQKYAAISEFIQKSFENIGLQVDIQNLQGGALRKEVYNSRVNFWRASWIADYPDGENYLALFYQPNHAPTGPNTTHFADPEVDALFERALRVPTDSLRYPIYQEIERRVLAEAPIIPLYYDRSLRILQPGIRGLSSNPMNHLHLERVRLPGQ